MKPIIEVKNLSKLYQIGAKESYGSLREEIMQAVTAPFRRLRPNTSSLTPNKDINLWALKDVSFVVQEGDVVGIIGRNGAGKSTLLKILSRITEPTSGRITLRGRVSSLLEVGTGFHHELTGRENIFLNGALLGMTNAEIRRKLDEIVGFAEIETFLDTPVKRYSSGMYIRLAFAVAAHLEPEILIIDEVLAVGDAQFQKKCLGKMGDVAKKGRTVLFVSHNLTAVRSLCNRAILLAEGVMVADGAADKVAGRYIGAAKNIFVHEWPDEKTAPQNASAILMKAAICNDDGDLLDEIYTDSPFNIEVEFKVKKDGSSVGLTIIFYDNENNCVFGTINNHESCWYGKAMPTARYKSVCKIPANLFNNGWFNVSINLFGKGFSDAQMTHEVLRIEILDGVKVRGDYYGAYEGVIRPMFNWTTNRMEGGFGKTFTS